MSELSLSVGDELTPLTGVTISPYSLSYGTTVTSSKVLGHVVRRTAAVELVTITLHEAIGETSYLQDLMTRDAGFALVQTFESHDPNDPPLMEVKLNDLVPYRLTIDPTLNVLSLVATSATRPVIDQQGDGGQD